MTLETINTYRSKQEQILAEMDQMHQSSNWTKEMEEREEKLNNKFYFLRMRIEEIESMISFYDGYEYIRAQY